MNKSEIEELKEILKMQVENPIKYGNEVTLRVVEAEYILKLIDRVEKLIPYTKHTSHKCIVSGGIKCVCGLSELLQEAS